MTHLYRIFIQKTSVPVLFSKILPVSSTIFVSFCKNSVPGRNLLGKGTDSKAKTIKSLRKKYSYQEFREFLMKSIKESKNEILQWKIQQINPKNVIKICSITGIIAKSCCWGWVLFDLKYRRILNFGGKMFTPISRQNVTEEMFDDLAYNLKLDIPHSDLYIMENCNYSRKKELLCMEMVLLSKLIVLLGSRCNCPESNIIMQKRSVLNSKFQLCMKTERTSAFHRILRIIDDAKAEPVSNEIILDILSLSNLRFKTEFVKYIKKSNSPVKESVSLALLLVLSYLDAEISKRRQLEN